TRPAAPRRSNRMSVEGLKSESRVRRPIDGTIHDLLPGIGAAGGQAALAQLGLRSRLDAGVRIGVADRFVDPRFEARIFLQHAPNMIALHQDARPPAAR